MSPVTAILGPRQCGKTTLAFSYGKPYQAHYFDLESVVDQRRLQNPELMLSSLDGVIILDEIQHQPKLFKSAQSFGRSAGKQKSLCRAG